jgi:molybdenum cofactor cytidylyltransferase
MLAADGNLPRRTMEIIGVLLAAGVGARFDPSGRRLKLLEPVGAGDAPAEPIALSAARALRAAVGPVIAVVRPCADANQARLHALLAAQGCTLTPCESGGMGDSIACAVRATPGAGGWIIALADMPGVQAATFTAVRAALQDGADAAAAFYRGRRGHPVGFGAACRAELAALTGEHGARAVLERHRPRCVEVDDPGVLLDIDVPADRDGLGDSVRSHP